MSDLQMFTCTYKHRFRQYYTHITGKYMSHHFIEMQLFSETKDLFPYVYYRNYHNEIS